MTKNNKTTERQSWTAPTWRKRQSWVEKNYERKKRGIHKVFNRYGKKSKGMLLSTVIILNNVL